MQHLSPYRVSARPEPEGPDQADEYEARLRLRARRTKHAVVGLITGFGVLSTLASVERSKHVDEEAATQRRETEARAAEKIEDARIRVAAATKVVEEEQARFEETMRAAIQDGSPLAELGASPSRLCDVSFPERVPFRSGIGSSRLPLLRVDRSDRVLPSPSLARVLTDIHRAEEKFGQGRHMEAILYSNALSDVRGRLKYDVVLATSLLQHPQPAGATSFDPGEAIGRAYVYDFAEHRVSCAGDIHVKSSKNIPYSWATAANAPASHDQGPSLSASLEEDFDRQIEQAITTRGALLYVNTSAR